jgi:hypothetical protein
LTAGDIVKGQLLVVETFTVKASEDIELGEVVYSDGNGVLAAPATATGPFLVALESHDYSEETSHGVECLVAGCVEAQKKTGTAIAKGQAIMVSSTDGEVTLWVKGDAPASYVEADVQTALDANVRRVGTCQADAASGDTTCRIWLGVNPG